MKRLFLSLALSLSLTLTPALAAGTLTVDGQAVEAAATVRGSTTYVSLRSVTQALQPDALILWTDGRALAEGAGFSLTARPGACYLEVNGRALYIPPVSYTHLPGSGRGPGWNRPRWADRRWSPRNSGGTGPRSPAAWQSRPGLSSWAHARC